MEPSLNKIKSILKKEIGLDTSTIGDSTIKKILNDRMRSNQITDLDEYYNFLSQNNEELNLLLETSVIPETWFFRDDKPFASILYNLLKQRHNNPNKICKILCIPCSTGEEPYSLAIFLRNNGIPETAYEIQAIDISLNSIAIAEQGVYGKNSFRDENSRSHIEKHFSYKDSEYSLNNNIKSSVKFYRANILDLTTFPVKQIFDFILCRNLLIYFDIPTKAIAYANLNNILDENGILYIGHSEFGSVPGDTFNTVKIDSTYCLVKKSNPYYDLKNRINYGESACKIPLSENNTLAAPRKAFSNIDLFALPKDNEKDNLSNHTRSNEKNNDIEIIHQARTMADNGNLRNAESLCYKYIDLHGDHEEAFFLLGLINEASGNTQQAQIYYKKSLYLNPKHYETLIHLSLLTKNMGDIETSQRLKERAERAERAEREIKE